ncbi:MAG: DUF3726 domain-containing protein [Gammaproteobacteria bacterium]|nr:DUF3726 domain-containing protein [Gammaproteobacteria bacterium]
MKASKTELLSLFKLAFEARGFDVGGYESAAELAVWAEMHGLRSFESIAAGMPHYSAQQRHPIELPMDNKHQLEIKLKGRSMLFCADLVSDLVYASALSLGYCAATVADCSEPELIIRKLAENRARGISGAACWQDGDLLRLAQTTPASCIPEILDFASQSEDQHANRIPEVNSLFLLYAAGEDVFQKLLVEYFPFLCGKEIAKKTSAELQENYCAALDRGIEISECFWQALVTLGNEVLVESSEQSRRGAGA